MTNYRRRKNKPKETGKQYRTNEEITAHTVRIIDEMGEMVGVFSLEEAIEKAISEGKDLVEINPKAEPPVAKLIEYSKFKYQAEKAEKTKAKNTSEVKTLLVSVRIAPHDLQVQARKADEFLKKGNKVRLQVRMRGRERSHPQLAMEVMGQFMGMITETYEIDSPAKLMGDSCLTFIKPAK
jgi:translation initiation factor IF-3